MCADRLPDSIRLPVQCPKIYELDVRGESPTRHRAFERAGQAGSSERRR